MNALRRMVWIFTSPGRVFEDIREDRAPWWQPWIVVSLVYLVVGWLMVPVNRAIVELNPRGFDPDKLDQQIEMMDKLAPVQVLATPFVMLLVGLIVAAITFVLVAIFAREASFKRYFSITWYASIVASLAQLISTVIVRARGVEAIESVRDASVMASLRFLSPDGVLGAFLGTFEVFTIWSLVLIGLGVKRVFDLRTSQAIWVVVPWWVILVVLSVLGEFFGGVSG